MEETVHPLVQSAVRTVLLQVFEDTCEAFGLAYENHTPERRELLEVPVCVIEQLYDFYERACKAFNVDAVYNEDPLSLIAERAFSRGREE